MLKQNPNLLNFEEEDEEEFISKNKLGGNQTLTSGFLRKVLRLKPEKTYDLIMR